MMLEIRAKNVHHANNHVVAERNLTISAVRDSVEARCHRGRGLLAV
jgi:hypothetical protein